MSRRVLDFLAGSLSGMLIGAVLLAALALAALVLHRIAVLHRESEERPLPRHLDPAICHAPWCGTSRTGQPDECDCGTGWVAA